MAMDWKKRMADFLQKMRDLGKGGSRGGGYAESVTEITVGDYHVRAVGYGARSTVTVTLPNGTVRSLSVVGGLTVTDNMGSTSVLGDGANTLHLTPRGVFLNGAPVGTAPVASPPARPAPKMPPIPPVGPKAPPTPPKATPTPPKAPPTPPKATPTPPKATPTPPSTARKKPRATVSDEPATPLFSWGESEEEARLAEEKHIEEVTSMDLPMDWENLYAEDERADLETESISDGLILSLNTLGRVDIEYIAKVSGTSPRAVIEELRGAIFQNPVTWGEVFYHGWETADEYLSGNLITKYNAAVEANQKYNGYFEDNVKALKRLLPDGFSTEDIYVTLGSPWLPSDVVDDFIDHLMGFRSRLRGQRVRHDEHTGIWEIPEKRRFYGTKYAVKDASVYGTPRMSMLVILEHTLNMRTIAIKDKVASRINKSGEALVINEKETVLALEKQAELLRAFGEWVWSDPSRATRLKNIYENRYGAIRRRQFDGSFLTFPEMNPAVTLYPYQKNAVARMLFTPNTLLAHDVGSGKTYAMIAAGMELRRMRKSEKNLYVVPNNLIGQWRAAFRFLYPRARILVIDPKSFTPAKREESVRLLHAGEYDAAVMAYSCFDALPLSPSFYDTLCDETVRAYRRSAGSLSSTAAIDRKIKSTRALFDKLRAQKQESGLSLAFDELGIGTLFVDEAHNYKNVPVDTDITYVLGISSSGSAKCRDMLHKCICVQRQNDGRGVIFATGTPITNSITDAFVMQKYLQSGELALLGLSSFDAWVGMFAEKTTEFEIGVDTSTYRLATRFARFHNLPELTAILSSVADFHQVDKQDGIPDFDGYTDALIRPTQAFSQYLRHISARADDVKNRRVRREEDNMLKITSDGRLAALDLRLVDSGTPFTFSSKAARCAEEVLRLYLETAEDKCAQLIFCDTSTPKAGFNMYDEMRRLLVSVGIPDGAIAYIHDATTEKRRNALFEAVREGDIRVLIGSTFKLGLGVNVQERLVAVHHLDVPWRPADMVQREGRILRQGNTCPRVYIHRYITEGSFDAYSWQLLETKQRFISQLLSGSLTDRTAGDVDSTVLNYAEIKALAIGNPRVKRRVELSNDLARLYILQREVVDARDRMRRELAELPIRIDKQKRLVAACRADMEYLAENRQSLLPEEARELRERVFAAVTTHAEKPVDTEILTYSGFRLSVPAFMRREHPCILVAREGSYRLELGTEGGISRRLEVFFDEFAARLKELRAGLSHLRSRKRSLEEELAREVDYMSRIDELRESIAEIDRELGVK